MVPTVQRSPRTDDHREREHAPLALARQLDHLALHHLAAHEQRVGLTTEEDALGRRPHELAAEGVGQLLALVGEPGAPAPVVELLEAPHVGAERPQRLDGPVERRPPGGVGHAVLDVRARDPHQRSLALPGRLRP